MSPRCGQVQQLVIVVNGVETGEVLERWTFQVEQAVDKENGGLVQQQVRPLYFYKHARVRFLVS